MVSFKRIIALATCTVLALAQQQADGEAVVSASNDDVQAVLDAQDAVPGKSPALKVNVTTSFPDAEIFGVKLVNGRATRALLRIVNNEPEPISVLVATGALLAPEGVAGAAETSQIIHNLTISKYSTSIPPNAAETITYSFSTVMNPQDVILDLKVLVQSKTSIFTLGVFRESVSIVEAPFSILDPQVIFLYLILAGVFGGTVFAIYTVWLKDLLPQKKRGGKGGERAKTSLSGNKKVNPSEQIPVVGADGPAVTTSSKGYDESWIPAGHINKPAPRRVGSRTKKAT